MTEASRRLPRSRPRSGPDEDEQAGHEKGVDGQVEHVAHRREVEVEGVVQEVPDDEGDLGGGEEHPRQKLPGPVADRTDDDGRRRREADQAEDEAVALQAGDGEVGSDASAPNAR